MRRGAFDPLTGVDTLAIVAVGLLMVLLLPGFSYVLNPRQAVIIAVLPLGTWSLIRLAINRGEPAALVAWSCIAIAVIGAIRAGDGAVTYLTGAMTGDLSVAMLLSAFGFWAIGRELTDHGRRGLEWVLTLGAGVNLVIGVYQMVTDPTTGIYATFDGRASGLMSNPVFYASALVGVWAIWFVKAARNPAWPRLLTTATFALAVGISGSRGAIAGAFVVMGTGVLRRPRRSTVSASLSAVVGFAAGLMLLGAASGSKSERIGAVDAGIGVRVDVWRTAVRAWAERPAFGWGLDPFGAALGARFTEESVRQYGMSLWNDPHNVFVLIALTLGAAGLVGVAGFTATGLVGRVDAVFAAAAAAIVLSWLLQPVRIPSWSLAFLLFGAAVRRHDPPSVRASRPGLPSDRRLHVGLLVIGCVAAGAFLVTSFRIASAIEDGDPAVAEARASWLMHDTSVAYLIARTYADSSDEGEALERDLMRAEVLAQEVVSREGPPLARALVTEVQLRLEHFDDALVTIQAWIEARPNDPVAYGALRRVAELSGRSELAELAYEKLCALGAPPCGTRSDNG